MRNEERNNKNETIETFSYFNRQNTYIQTHTIYKLYLNKSKIKNNSNIIVK